MKTESCVSETVIANISDYSNVPVKLLSCLSCRQAFIGAILTNAKQPVSQWLPVDVDTVLHRPKLVLYFCYFVD